MKKILPTGDNFLIGNSYRLAMREIIEYHLSKINNNSNLGFYKVMMAFLDDEIDRFCRITLESVN